MLLDRLLHGEVVDGADIARVLGTSPRSVTHWQSARSVPRCDSEERLLELKAVAAQPQSRPGLREAPRRGRSGRVPAGDRLDHGAGRRRQEVWPVRTRQGSDGVMRYFMPEGIAEWWMRGGSSSRSSS